MENVVRSDFVSRDDLAIQVRDGLFRAASRTYAEQYVEPLVRARYELHEPTSNDHDAISADGTTFEIKACKVLKTSTNRAGKRSLLERVLYENSNAPTQRLVPFQSRDKVDFDANVQNVKRDHFDMLLYVLLFEDTIKVFEAESEQIATGIFRGWSDKHGRYDALGKSGQFSVNRRTIEWHLQTTLKDSLTYNDAVDIFARTSE